MNLQQLLRKRASRARILSAIWMVAALCILVGASIYAPMAAGVLLGKIADIEVKSNLVGDFAGKVSGNANAEEKLVRLVDHPEILTFAIALLIVLLACFAGYLVARAGLHEMMMAARWNGLADAVCISKDVASFEKVAPMLVPRSRMLSGSDVFSAGDLKALNDAFKTLRGS